MASKQQAELERKPEQMPTPPVQQQLQQFPQLPLACPRCKSSKTKFCYFNNHSLLQPRYYCKDCKRFWTVGGALRNVPVGGRSRRNKSKKSRRPRAVVQYAAPETMNNWLAAPVATAGLPGSAPALTSFLPSIPFGGGTGGIVPSGLELPEFDPNGTIEGCPASSVVSLPSLNPLFGGFNYQEQQQPPQLPGFGPAWLPGMNPCPGMSLTGDGWLAPQPMNSPLIATVSTAVTVADTAPLAWEGSNAAESVFSKEEGGGEDWKLYLSARGPDTPPSSSPVI